MRFQSAALAVAAAASVAEAKTISVGVGADSQLVFKPNVLTADVGDIVQFWYYPQNHSVVQSTGDAPCVPSPDAWYSGYVPVSSGRSAKSWEVTIKDKKPVWLYCSQSEHCQSGMSMVINPERGGLTLKQYQAKAQNVKEAKWPKQTNGGKFVDAKSSGGSGSGSGSGSGGSPTTYNKPTGTVTGATTTSTTSNAAVADAVAGGFVSGFAGLAAWLII